MHFQPIRKLKYEIRANYTENIFIGADSDSIFKSTHDPRYCNLQTAEDLLNGRRPFLRLSRVSTFPTLNKLGRLRLIRFETRDLMPCLGLARVSTSLKPTLTMKDRADELKPTLS